MGLAVLSSVVAALAVAVGANFLITLAVLRRLRLQVRQRVEDAGISLPASGSLAPTFAVTTTSGDAIDGAGFYRGRSVILGFFSTNCPACERIRAELQRAPLSEPFLAFVRAPLPGERRNDSDAFVDAFTRSGALVSTYAEGDGIVENFSIRALPTLLRVDNGVIAASSFRLADISTKPATRDADGSAGGRRLSRALVRH